MARMIPLELKEGEYLTLGEKEIFDTLKLNLSDEWLVIYSLKWSTEDGVVINKSQGESDFVLAHKDYGVLIIEVKDGKIGCINGEWSSISYNNIKSIIKNPEEQANKAKINLLSIFKKNKLKVYITTAVWFPDCIAEKCTLPLSMPKEIILDMNSFKNIEDRIIEIFKYRAEKEAFQIYSMIDSDFKKLSDILNPKMTIKMPLLKFTNKIDMRLTELNREQNEFFQQLDGNKIISVNGHAGTGKTLLAFRKALRESKENKRVLFLCYNNLLNSKIKQDSNGEFEVFSIYGLAEEYLRLHNNEAYERFQSEGNYDEMIDSFLNSVKENREKNKMFFDSIIIDEGQDFKKEWMDAIDEMLVEDGSLCVFYDENQTLYDKYGRGDISFLNRGVKYTLKKNMRNTDEICLSSLNVIKADKDSISLKGVSGIKPDIIFAEDSLGVATHLKNCISQLKREEELNDENISVITIEAKKKMIFKKEISEVFKGTVESIRRYKGLENDIIIIPDLKSDFMKDEEIRKLLYVGMSRAKSHVILIIDTEVMNRKQRVDYKKEIKELLQS